MKHCTRRSDCQRASDMPRGHKTLLRLAQDTEVKLSLARNTLLHSPERVAVTFQALACLDREVLVVVALDCRCRLVHWNLLAVGCSDRMAVRIGEAFCGAIRCRARSILLVHNHPSDSLKPSREDLALTRQVAQAGNILGYPLLDHVIVSRQGYRSLMRPDTHERFGTTVGLRPSVSAAANESRGRLSRRSRARSAQA